jgi:dTDP-glucose pyrophosphorylase
MARWRLEDCVVPEGGTLRDALRSLEKSGAEIALAIAPSGQMLGTLTDGDIRRAILAGATVDSPLAPHVHQNFIWVEPSASHAEVLHLMHARSISEVPVLDRGRKLVGLHLLSDFLAVQERPNWVVIMAGGRGARLAPLTNHVPKPMIRVAGRPIIERIVFHLVGHGFSRIFISTNYLGHLVEQHFGDGARFGARIEYLREETPLGTGGALSLLPGRPDQPLLVMNGDLVTQANLGALLDFHERERPLATIGLRRYCHTVPFGCVKLADSRVVEFEEKPTLERMVSAGIYVLSPELVARVPPRKEFPLPALFEDCLRQGEPVAGFEIEDDWIDVGQRENLRQARGGE